MQPQNSQQALAQLQQQQQKVQNPNDILGSQRQQLGVNSAQETVSGLRGAINNTTKLLQQVAPSVMGRTANSLVTNAQATRQVSNESAPLQQSLTDQGTQYGQANENLSRLEQQASQAATGIYQDQQNRQSYLQNLYDTLYKREADAQAAQRAELDRQEQIRQFNEQLAASRASQAAANRQFNLGQTGTSNKTAPQAAQSGVSTQQDAYNDVYTRINRDNEQALISDYRATADSAKRGNLRDQYKIEIYNQLKPELFKFPVSVGYLPIANKSQLRF